MLLSCFQRGRIIWCFCLRSSSKTCKQHWFRSVSATIFNRTEGRRCVCSFVKLPHEFYAVCVSVSWCLLEHTMIPGHKFVLFALLWLGCAWQFLTCVMTCADTETEYGTDWFTQGRCEAPGIHVDSFCPDIMYLPMLQSSHCTYCMSLATGSDQIRQSFSLMSPSWWFLFSTCFTVTTEYMTHESNESSFAFDSSTHTDSMELVTKDYIFVTNSKMNSWH